MSKQKCIFFDYRWLFYAWKRLYMRAKAAFPARNEGPLERKRAGRRATVCPLSVGEMAGDVYFLMSNPTRTPS